jgi:hypothetical protein
MQLNMFWYITLIYWCLLLIASIIGYSLTNIDYIQMLLFLTITSMCLNLVHRLGHTSYWKEWTTAHLLGHHVAAYPGKSMVSNTYRLNPYDRYSLNTLLYLYVVILVITIISIICRWSLIQIAYVTVVVIGFILLENYVHNSIHLTNNGSWIYRQAWFHYLREMHFLHHSGKMKCNYAIVSLWTDYVYQTLVQTE